MSKTPKSSVLIGITSLLRKPMLGWRRKLTFSPYFSLIIFYLLHPSLHHNLIAPPVIKIKWYLRKIRQYAVASLSHFLSIVYITDDWWRTWEELCFYASVDPSCVLQETTHRSCLPSTKLETPKSQHVVMLFSHVRQAIQLSGVVQPTCPGTFRCCPVNRSPTYIYAVYTIQIWGSWVEFIAKV